ncbi:MAG: hypothetical protein QM831_34860 [Kofleriaceae bacterium]
MKLLIAMILVLGGCQDSQFDGADSLGDDGNGSDNPTTGGGARECNIASDCAAAAAKCCDCPSYAAPKSDPTVQACAGVMCPPNDSCPANVEVACNQGKCELACVAMACTNTCTNGYALDASGCLSCDCADVTQGLCTADNECVEVNADCCGCAAGGADTSVSTQELTMYEQNLRDMCPQSPSCPGSNTCDTAAAPTCVQGTCHLIDPLPAAACGRDDLPACPSGTVCTVNSSNPATDHRVGVCL